MTQLQCRFNLPTFDVLIVCPWLNSVISFSLEGFGTRVRFGLVKDYWSPGSVKSTVSEFWASRLSYVPSVTLFPPCGDFVLRWS